MTNNSIFTRVLALMICLVMLVGTLTACFQETNAGNHVGTTENGEVTTKPTTPTTPSTGDGADNKDPVEDPVDPNEIFSASTDLIDGALIYGALANDVLIGDAKMGALVPADVKVEAGASTLALSVKKVEEDVLDGSLSNLDIHIDGVASDNTVPMIVKLGPVLAKGLGATELKLYHIENGAPVLMTRVEKATDFAIHNQYIYDAETGEVTIYVASFSVFYAVKTSASKWEDTTEADTSWYNDEDREFILNDVADFLGFRNLVDGGNTFEGKTVILATDIDLSNKPFDPIGFGYWYEKNVVEGKDQNTVFMGTFDGGNHTIYNLYENCWELDPDKENYSTYTYSTAGAGLFASIKNATIKNLAVSGAEIVFECVDMGVVVGYAQGSCHFENIVVTDSKIANYNRYTGGVVGEVSYGPYGIDTSLGYSHTFKNVTVDSSVTVSGLWGSFGCGMGGVIGGKWGDATVKMENVVSAPVMDVYNDVVSAYQWYAFRGCGMLIGHTEEPYSDGRHSGNATASFLTCVNVNVYYGDWTKYNYYEFANQDNATGRNYPWVRAEEGNYCDAFSNIRYGVPTHTVEGVTTAVSELSPEELEKVATDHVVITFDQLYGADRGMYGTNKHEGVNVSYKSPKTFYIKNNVGWENLTLHYIYEIGEETWTTIPDGVELVEFNGVYRIDLPVGAKSFTITADGDYTSKEFIVSELTEKETLLLGTTTCTHETTTTITENVVNATCTANGSYDKVTKCADCGEEISRETITTEKLAHTHGETVVENRVESSCTATGSYDNVVYCSVCNAEISREKVTVDAKGHTPGDAATCTTAQTCTVCGAVIKEALGHKYDNACDADCNECGAERTPADHVYDNACDADCNVCGATRTPADHVYDNACDADCNVCGAERTPADHVYDNACDTTCNVCGATRTVGEHKWNISTCKCSVCGVAATTKTIYFQNNWLWTNVKVSDSTTTVNMTKVENDGVYDIYKITLPEDCTVTISDGTTAVNKHTQPIDVSELDNNAMLYMNYTDKEGHHALIDDYTTYKNGYRIVRLKPTDWWTGARYAAYVWNASGNKWIDMVDVNGDGIYTCWISNDYTNIKFGRMNPENSENSFTYADKGGAMWNETGDLSIPTNTECYYAPLIDNGCWLIDIYLKPNSNWTQSNARFAVYCWYYSGSTKNEKWYSMSSVGNGMYMASIDVKYVNIIFCRMNGSNIDNNWNNKWNQTGDLVTPTDNKVKFDISGTSSWDNMSKSYWKVK